MDQAQAKALAALQPFVHLATTTKSPSPRFLAELIKGAVSAPGTYVFTELLQSPAIQSLRGSDSEPWLTLLEVFSWGTYEEYKAIPSLPALDEAQTLKLRQLSLLTLSSPLSPSATSGTSTLTYPSLLAALDLSDPRSLEALVTTSIYSGLMTARLSPTSTPPVVNITSVAPLRDLRPQSLPALLQILQTWESRCSAVVSDLEAQIQAIKASAAQRTSIERRRQAAVDIAVLSERPPESTQLTATEYNVRNAAVARQQRGTGQRPPGKRGLDQQMEGEGEEFEDDDDGRMDVDEGLGADMGHAGGGGGGGGRGGGAGGSRGAKRNRGRGPSK